jgi:hypothetical protein
MKYQYFSGMSTFIVVGLGKWPSSCDWEDFSQGMIVWAYGPAHRYSIWIHIPHHIARGSTNYSHVLPHFASGNVGFCIFRTGIMTMFGWLLYCVAIFCLHNWMTLYRATLPASASQHSIYSAKRQIFKTQVSQNSVALLSAWKLHCWHYQKIYKTIISNIIT